MPEEDGCCFHQKPGRQHLLTGAGDCLQENHRPLLLRSAGGRGLSADLSHHPDRSQQGPQDLRDKDFGALVSFYWHTWKSLKTPNVTTNKAAIWDPITMPHRAYNTPAVITLMTASVLSENWLLGGPSSLTYQSYVPAY